MAKFFCNDFTQERWRKAALKNAFALLSKQRFEHAAAFFLLVGNLWDAVEVCINRLHDLQLALVVTRLYEGDNGPNFNKLLKENILGIPQRGSLQTEPNPDPFLRSMSLWLLQDYSGSLETLIVDLKPGLESGSKSSNTTIFNFYFYLRSHPLLIRRIHPVKKGHSIQPSASIMDFTSKFHGQSLSGVGEEPLTPTERNLVFTTAYHHLNSGSPLLALTVLSKLPKTEDLGQTDDPMSSLPSRNNSQHQRSASFDAVMSGLITSGKLLTGMEGESTVTFSNSVSEDTDCTKPLGAIQEEDDFDWSKPMSMQAPAEEDEFDWSKPVSNQPALDEDDFDWSKPVSSQLQLSDEEEPKSEQTEETEENQLKPVLIQDNKVKMPISQRGLFIISLAEQLQYNALLSILTEELATIHIPSCCKYLWESRGKEALPLLPLSNESSEMKSMVEWFEDEAFEHSLVSLQITLVDWLRSETQIVKEVCGMEISDGSSHCLISVKQASHAGYDLLTTLLNYTALHAGTMPSMLAVKTELMHLMNTLLPWSTGLPQEIEDVDTDVGQIASCAINPTQLPILTSCSLPAKHPLNLSLHIKLLSASIFESISSHACPPNVHCPLVQMDRVFELCISLSHCISLCLAPVRLQSKRLLSRDNLLSTTGSSSSVSSRRQRQGSGSDILEVLSSFESSKSRPSKWPGLPNWPNSLLSDDGKEASPLCLILMEALIVVYTGLLSVAWSKHSIYDLLILLANIPSQEKWSKLFGGAVTEKKNPSSLIKKMRKHDKKWAGRKEGLYMAPKKSLLRHCLTKVRINFNGCGFNVSVTSLIGSLCARS